MPRHTYSIYCVTTDWITHEKTAKKVPGFTRQGPRGFSRLMIDADRLYVERGGIYTRFEVRRHDTNATAYAAQR